MSQAAEATFLPLDSPRETACVINLPAFEGPLDLLLHLIQKHELDIIDIPIGFITQKYLEYLDAMQGLSIDIASEYLVMAATLAHIKSKMLLPVVPSGQEDGLEQEVEDPRAELVRRLLEYQKYKHAAAALSERSRFGVDVFSRALLEEAPKGPAPLENTSVFSLIEAFNRIFARRKITVDHEINFDRVTITERINELVDLLRGSPKCSLDDLLTVTMTRSDLVVTFLALLEMTRLRLTRLYQAGPLSPLYIELALVMDDTTGDEPEPAAAP